MQTTYLQSLRNICRVHSSRSPPLAPPPRRTKIARSERAPRSAPYSPSTVYRSMTNQAPRRPTPQEIRAAAGKTLPDVIAPGLDVLFCGINPWLYTAAVGHHFARPGNRFWKALHEGGFTPRLLSPWEEGLLPGFG